MARPMIEIVDLWKSFGTEQVLRGATLSVASETICALLGASGSGKTVLIKHLLGLLQPDRGVVRLDGRDVPWLGPEELHALRLELGILFQAGALFDSLTVFDNVAFPLREQLHLREPELTERVHQTLALLDLEGVDALFPAELSGGMRKRVAFARAIVGHPKILLIDEPTAGLDPITTASVADEILLAKRELHVTTLAITHDVASALRIADTVALLHEGRIIEHSPAAQFRSSTHPAVIAFLHNWLEREEAARGVPAGAAGA